LIQEQQKIINLGIFAHVDAGKTTITENLLHRCGILKEPGRVDKGSTQTDSMIQERERGISIQSSPVSFPFEDIKINLIDTPGHVDFVAEVERTINILDGAILVLSAREGVQSHTRLLFRSLRKLEIPVIFFINKIDRAGCHIPSLLSEIRSELTDNILPVQKYEQSGTREASVSGLFDFPVEETLDFLADRDNRLLERYLRDEVISQKDLEQSISELSKSGNIYPLLFGCGLRGTGMDQLLKGIECFIPPASGAEDPSTPPAWQVFKITRSEDNTKQIYVRVFSGRIDLWDSYGSHKVTRILRLKKGRTEPVKSLPAGEIGIIQGLKELKVNDSFGDMSRRKQILLGQPTLRYAVKPVSPANRAKMIRGLSLISEGDPYLEYELNNERGDIFLNLFGDVQMEILKDLLLRNHSVDIDFQKPEIIYRERAGHKSEWTIEASDPQNPYPASLRIEVEPHHPGGGNSIESNVPEGNMPRGLLRGAFEGIEKALKEGPQGWEITDTRITVLECSHFTITTPADFRNLAQRVTCEALNQSDTLILWPLLRFEMEIPGELYGKAMEDILKTSARNLDITNREKLFGISGTAPAELFRSHEKKIAGYTRGEGFITTFFDSWEKAPDNFQKKGV